MKNAFHVQSVSVKLSHLLIVTLKLPPLWSPAETPFEKKRPTFKFLSKKKANFKSSCRTFCQKDSDV